MYSTTSEFCMLLHILDYLTGFPIFFTAEITHYQSSKYMGTQQVTFILLLKLLIKSSKYMGTQRVTLILLLKLLIQII